MVVNERTGPAGRFGCTGQLSGLVRPPGPVRQAASAAEVALPEWFVRSLFCSHFAVISRSLRSGPKRHLGLRRLRSHCPFIAQCLRMLKMPFLGLWRLRSHCAVAQNAISGPLKIARSFVWCLKKPYFGLWRLCGHCEVA